MTWINVNAQELVTVASALAGVATEAADVGSGLTTCARCPMPADIEGVVRQILVVTDAIVDELARRIAADALDLLTRAGVVGTDSLSAATTAVDGLYPSMATIGGGGSGFTIVSGSGLLGGGMGLIGGTPPLEITVSDGLLAGMGTIGGTAPTTITISEGPVGGGMGTIGGYTGGFGAGGGGMGSAIMTLAETAQGFRERAQRRIDGIIANPNSSNALIGFALGQQDALNDSMRTLTAPSRADIARDWGYMPTLSEFHALNTGGFDGIV